MQLLGLAIFTPIVSWVAERIVLAAGEPVISNYDIARFVLSPSGVVFVVVVAALTLALVLAELAGQSWLAGHAITQRPINLVSTVAFVLRRLPQLILLSARVFLRLAVLLLPFLAAAGIVWVTMLAWARHQLLPRREPCRVAARKADRRACLAAGYALLAAWQLARWIYAVPILVLEGVTPPQALGASMRMTKGRVAQIVTPLVLWWLIVTAALVAITWVCRHASDAGLVWAGIEVQRVLPLGGVVCDGGARRRFSLQRSARRRSSVPGRAHVRRSSTTRASWQLLRTAELREAYSRYVRARRHCGR